MQQLCDRVVILHRGHLTRVLDMNALGEDTDTMRLRLTVATPERAILPGLRALPCVERAETLPTMNADITELRLSCRVDAGDPRDEVFRLLSGLNAPIRQMTEERDTLEEAFLRATAEE